MKEKQELSASTVTFLNCRLELRVKWQVMWRGEVGMGRGSENLGEGGIGWENGVAGGKRVGLADICAGRLSRRKDKLISSFKLAADMVGGNVWELWIIQIDSIPDEEH